MIVVRFCPLAAAWRFRFFLRACRRNPSGEFVEIVWQCRLGSDPGLVEELIFGFGLLKCQLVRDLACVGQDLSSVDRDEGVQLGGPIVHVHRDMLHGLPLGEDQILFGEVVQCADLRFREVVFRDSDIRLADLRSPETGQPHVRLRMVGTGSHDFCGGLPGDRPVHLVLHGLEELNADLRGRVVVDAGGVDVRDLLIEPFFRGADCLDAFQQFIEVIEWLVWIRNCVATLDLIRYPTEMMRSRL